MEKNPRQIKRDYDYKPSYNFDYDLEKESWYKDVKSAYIDATEEN